MHCVSGAISDYLSQNAMTEQGEIADQVENLVAYELIAKTERPVLNASIGQHDGVLFRSATNESHVAQRALVSQKTKGSSGCDFSRVDVSGKVEIVALDPDRVRKVDCV